MEQTPDRLATVAALKQRLATIVESTGPAAPVPSSAASKTGGVDVSGDGADQTEEESDRNQPRKFGQRSEFGERGRGDRRAGRAGRARNSGGTRNGDGTPNTDDTGSGDDTVSGDATGSTRKRREPRGHPEDALGDPEAVAKSICLRLLTDSARPRANLLQALTKREIPIDVANKVLDRFTELGLIDDDAYAQAYVRTKHKERGLGRRALAMELRRKGIADDIAAEALQEVNADDEWARGRILIAKRINSALSAGPEAAKRRLVGLLARRGYSASMSYELVNSALRDHGIEDQPDQDGPELE